MLAGAVASKYTDKPYEMITPGRTSGRRLPAWAWTQREVRLRAEKAALLGYETFAHYKLDDETF